MARGGRNYQPLLSGSLREDQGDQGLDFTVAALLLNDRCSRVTESQSFAVDFSKFNEEKTTKTDDQKQDKRTLY